MENWIKDLFGVNKPVIGMCHLNALPGDPGFDRKAGLAGTIDWARRDLAALQDGGVDAVMFSNEFSRPYLTRVQPITVASMGRIIGELLAGIRIPFGVDVLWDPYASLDLAMATGARFIREVFSGVYASDFGLWSLDCGDIIRHQHAIGAEGVKLLFNIVPEAARYLGERNVTEIARSTVFNLRPDGLCVSGLTAGVQTDLSILKQVKEAAGEVPVFANTGVRLENVAEQLSLADGAVIGTAFKEAGNTWNPVDVERVKAIMDEVRKLRSG